MPSATTADSSDSMAQSKAMVKASGSTACNFSRLNGGSDGAGSERGTAPKREATVATSRWKAKQMTPVTAMAIRKPGQRGR